MIRTRLTLWLFASGLLLALGDIAFGFLRSARGVHEPVALAPGLYAAALASACLWLRAPLEQGRERTFWHLWAVGAALWVANDILLGRFAQGFSRAGLSHAALAFTYIPQTVLMAALVLQPEAVAGELRDPVVRYEAALVGLCWVYLYLLLIVPWSHVLPDPTLYWRSFLILHNLQNSLLVLWLGILGLLSRGRWRTIYLHLTAAILLFTFSIGQMHIDYATGRLAGAMIFETLVAISFLWIAWVAATAPPATVTSPAPQSAPSLGSGNWLAALATLGIPLIAAWFSFLAPAPSPVRRYRLALSLVVIGIATAIAYRREMVAGRQCNCFLDRLDASLAGLRRLQGQFAEAGKFASLGQLAAGAAHEINNPVAAMLGYAELIRADPSASPRALELAVKIGDQSRRIRSLVNDLLSLACQRPTEFHCVDPAALLQSAIALRRISADRPKIQLRVAFEDSPLEVHGDADKLLQLFYGLLLALADENPSASSAIDVSSSLQDGRVIFQFLRPASLDSSVPLLPPPDEARRAARGIGLSLAACVGIASEHNGSLTSRTLADGGIMFQLDLPAIVSQPIPAT